MTQKESNILVLGLEGVATLLAVGARILTRRYVNRLEARLFLMEMLATFQLCAYIGQLQLLSDTVEPNPQLYLAHIYIFTTLHFLQTLTENISNPACTLLYILRKGISIRLGGLKIVAQFTGSLLARLYFNVIYVLGMRNLLSEPNACDFPLQTTLLKAFCTELVTSITFQFTMLESQPQETRYRAHVLAIAITSLVYAGGHLTGAIFNPALALSLHMSCFMDKFWNYMLVYWIAPCLGSALVVLLWDEILPRMRTRV